MNKKIKKELIFFNENAELLRNNYDPVVFEFEGFNEYSIIIIVDPIYAHIHVQRDKSPELFFEYSKHNDFYYVGGKETFSREMTKKEKKLFKKFFNKVYDNAKKSYQSWL